MPQTSNLLIEGSSPSRGTKFNMMKLIYPDRKEIIKLIKKAMELNKIHYRNSVENDPFKLNNQLGILEVQRILKYGDKCLCGCGSTIKSGRRI